MTGLVDINGRLILFALGTLLIWVIAFQNLIGVFKRRLYSADASLKEGVWAVVWGLMYFIIFALIGSLSFQIATDWGYNRSVIVGLFISLVIIAIPLSFLYERLLKSRLPIYDPDQVASVTYQHLPLNLQSTLKKDDINLILDLEFEYQQKIGLVKNVGEIKTKQPIEIDEQDLRVFIASKAKEKGKNYPLEHISAVLKAEEVYLKQIEILSNQKDQIRNGQKPQPTTPTVLTTWLGTSFWRVFSIIFIIGVIIFAKSFLVTRFNSIFFIKESIFNQKIPLKETLKIVPYYEQLQHNFPSYIKLNNLDTSIRIAYAQYYLDQKKFDQALNYIQKALKKDDKFLPAYTTYGHYFIDQEKVDQAIEMYHKAAQINENIPVIHASLCWGYYNKQDIEKAIGYCHKALKIDPKYGLVYGYLVRLYTLNGDYQKAVESYQKAKRQDIDKSYVHYFAALAHKELNQLPEARTAIGKSLDKDPKSMDAYILSSEIRYLQGDEKEAIERLERVAQANPKEANVLDYLATLYTLEGRFQEAIRTYQKALNISDSVVEKARIYENLGLVYYNNTKQFALAEEAFKNALKYDPKQATIYINLGETYRAKGMLKEAVSQQKAALQLDPQHALAHNNLGYTLALQGNIAEAIVEFKKALEIDPDLTIAKENLQNFQKK
ncbi:tetratricopeptide repeat protein [Candidatus Daviesbacteria bacterium]|nr:tetratricopeptide repeat protein [Candidatus Daviesbacteria bacterium]